MAEVVYEMDFICRNCGRIQGVLGEVEEEHSYIKHECLECEHPNVFAKDDFTSIGHSDERIISLEKHWETDNETDFNSDEPDFNPVHKPQGYNSYDLETINAIRGQSTDEEFQGYLKGNVMKYVARYNFKNGVEDLEKLIIYAEFLRDHVKGEWKK